MSPLDVLERQEGVAVRVDELVRDRHIMDYFRRQIRQWRAEVDARAAEYCEPVTDADETARPKWMRGKSGYQNYVAIERDGDPYRRCMRDPLNPLSIQAMTPAEKCAWLAAVHDVRCYVEVERIDPWHDWEDDRDYGRSDRHYACLCGWVEDLTVWTETDCDRIESILCDVQADIATAMQKGPGADKKSSGPAEEASEADAPKIPDRALKAWQQYEEGLRLLDGHVEKPTDQQVYRTLESKYRLTDEVGNLLPFERWTRYLRTYRSLTGQQKNKPRAGREQPVGSCVRYDQVDAKELPTRIRRKSADE
jgi:hypothetical protein